MKQETVPVCGIDLPACSCNTVVVGSGAAGLNAADSLYNRGQRDILLLTDGVGRGTSRNTGSDKQTYYKLTAAGGEPDSVREMARSYFDGGCMHGDIALIEAALSSRCFYKLVEAGVPFPCNEYGEYAGYRTDHDRRLRATSAGPLTSKLMTESLERLVRAKGIPVFDGFTAVAILTQNGAAVGVLALDRSRLGGAGHGLTLFNCRNVVYATGGPAGVYAASVYPGSQTGMSGIAFEAGAKGANLTEWQYGIASTKFRWNLSGTYQQVIPRCFSADPAGGDEREFLDGYFETPGAALDAVFLKGYQWPFDPRKVRGGSSLVDLAVYVETQVKGRRVFLDYRRNPACAGGAAGFDFSLLGAEAREYLARSGALFETPFRRLEKMNAPAVALYRAHGIDLAREPLEIAVCAQHNNGGLLGDIWWQSDLRRFFPIGEVNGTFGVYRPGGSALNSTQVGGARAAEYIARSEREDPPEAQALAASQSEKIGEILRLAENFLSNTGGESGGEIRRRAQEAMSRCAAQIRSPEEIGRYLQECRRRLEALPRTLYAADPSALPAAFVTRDILVTQFVYLSAMRAYFGAGGGSRGSYLVADPKGEPAHPKLPDDFRFTLDDGRLNGKIEQTALEKTPEGLRCRTEWADVRPIPDGDTWFENVWNGYRRRNGLR